MDFELDTHYGVSQPGPAAASSLQIAGWLAVAGRATTQYVTSAVRTLAGSMRREKSS